MGLVQPPDVNTGFEEESLDSMEPVVVSLMFPKERMVSAY
jgi:hypothetical protein